MATSLNGKLPKLKNELALYESLSSVLKMGPRGVRELMNQGTWSAEIRRYLGAIDEIAAAKTGEMAAMAEFDAALLLRLAVDLNSPADYYEDLASRFLRASSKSSSAELKEESARYAKEAKDIAAFIRANPMVGKANTDEAKNADGLESAQ